MAKSGRRGQQHHTNARPHHGAQKSSEALPAFTAEQSAQLNALQETEAALAAALRSAAPEGRDALTAALAPVESVPVDRAA